MPAYRDHIALRMQEAIETYCTAEPLKRYALLFVEEKLKGSMLFGELTAAHYYMFEGHSADIARAAAAVELFVLASDILDDLEDEDAPSMPWMGVPAPHALHVAASLMTLSQQTLLDSVADVALRGELAVMMNKQMLRSANGQMLDLMNTIQEEEPFLEMVRQKSSSLLVLACMAGVLAAGRPWNEEVAMYAADLGIAAQIRNDCRDLLRWDEKSDFLGKKKTLLTLYLLEGPEEQSGWMRDYYEGRSPKEDIRDKHSLFLQICEQSGVLLYGSVISRMHYDKFQDRFLAIEADSKSKDRVIQLLTGEFA
ncbi:polyprenyl synthetase family protein [Paenibacillus sp. GCM10027627]|uniref:polyprenyl synthetase family protein n=1 Tax=unclassified Paenibacillus TaxID=185978 RepID=UPI00362B3065